MKNYIDKRYAKKHEPEIIIRKCADSIKYAKTDIKQQKNCLNGLFLPHKKKYKTSSKRNL